MVRCHGRPLAGRAATRRLRWTHLLEESSARWLGYRMRVGATSADGGGGARSEERPKYGAAVARTHAPVEARQAPRAQRTRRVRVQRAVETMLKILSEYLWCRGSHQPTLGGDPDGNTSVPMCCANHHLGAHQQAGE
jgi:hypothetical protein